MSLRVRASTRSFYSTANIINNTCGSVGDQVSVATKAAHARFPRQTQPNKASYRCIQTKNSIAHCRFWKMVPKSHANVVRDVGAVLPAWTRLNTAWRTAAPPCSPCSVLGPARGNSGLRTPGGSRFETSSSRRPPRGLPASAGSPRPYGSARNFRPQRVLCFNAGLK